MSSSSPPTAAPPPAAGPPPSPAAETATPSPNTKKLWANASKRFAAAAKVISRPGSPSRGVPSTVLVETVASPALSPSKIELTLDTTGQFTLSWGVPIKLASDKGKLLALSTLPPGKMNCYLYPLVQLANDEQEPPPSGFLPVAAAEDDDELKDEPKPTMLHASGGQLRVLEYLLLAAAADPSSAFFSTPDVVGAFLIHGLVVCNTAESIDLSWRLMQSNLSLVTQTHTKHRQGFPLFEGESNLHIACVNQREQLFLNILNLAATRLTRKELASLLRSQAAGVFFEAMPMRYYGGTVLSYACCFELREAVMALLKTNLVGLNDTKDACCISGFLPLHAVTANGLTHMYEFLTKELPEVKRANEAQRTAVGRMEHLGLHSLTPLQLAAKQGDHAMFKRILHKQCAVMWVWGPVTQYSINLRGVDSAGQGGGDVMELIGRIDATRGTTELLLDDHLQGFIYQLFVLKWRRFGRYIHWTRRSLDVALLILVVTVGFSLKAEPYVAASTHLPAAIVMAVIMAIGVEEEVRLAYLYWRNTQALNTNTTPSSGGGAAAGAAGTSSPDGSGGASPAQSWRARAAMTSRWCKQHAVHVMAASYALIGSACAIILSGSLPHAPPNNASSVPVLAAVGNENENENDGETQTIEAIMWLVLALGTFLQMSYLATNLFTPFRETSVFMLSVTRMFKDDLLIFLVLFSYFFLAFFFALFLIYPRAGERTVDVMPQFNNWYSAAKGQLEVALIGNAATMQPEVLADPSLSLSAFESIDMALFLVLYYFFVLISLILLLNLLIAMLSHTFTRTQTESILQSRIAFASTVLKLELAAETFHMNTFVGEKSESGDGSYVYVFRSVQKNSEGGGIGGSEQDPFVVPDEGGPMARLEARLMATESKVDELIAMGGGHGGGAAGGVAGRGASSRELEDGGVLEDDTTTSSSGAGGALPAAKALPSPTASRRMASSAASPGGSASSSSVEGILHELRRDVAQLAGTIEAHRGLTPMEA